MKIGICESILFLNQTAQVSCINNDINKITWHDGNPTNITNEQILAKQAELQQIEDVYENRRKEYGNWQSQLDEIYHDGIDAWKDRISAIKLKYPKE